MSIWASELAINFPVVREQFGNMDALFKTDGESSLSSLVLSGTGI